MKILEFQCKNCQYTFTRAVKKYKKSKKVIKEKCANCGKEAIIKREVDLKQFNLGCSACERCGGCK